MDVWDLGVFFQLDALEVSQAEMKVARLSSSSCWGRCEVLGFLLLSCTASEPAFGSGPERGGCHNLSACEKRCEKLSYSKLIVS